MTSEPPRSDLESGLESGTDSEIAAEIQTLRTELVALRREQEQWAEREAKARAARDRALKAADALSVALDTRLRLDRAGQEAAGARGGLRASVSRLVRREKPMSAEEAAQLELIRASSLFDGPWYLRNYPDVALAGEDPALHFLRFPLAPLRRPCEAFDTGQYVADHPEVFRDKVNPLVHFLSSPGSESADRYPPLRR